MGWLMQKVNKPYVHDVVNALSQVIIEVLVAGGGDAEEPEQPPLAHTDLPILQCPPGFRTG